MKVFLTMGTLGIIFCCILLTGCGQSGHLYLPNTPETQPHAAIH